MSDRSQHGGHPPKRPSSAPGSSSELPTVAGALIPLTGVEVPTATVDGSTLGKSFAAATTNQVAPHPQAITPTKPRMVSLGSTASKAARHIDDGEGVVVKSTSTRTDLDKTVHTNLDYSVITPSTAMELVEENMVGNSPISSLGGGAMTKEELDRLLNGDNDRLLEDDDDPMETGKEEGAIHGAADISVAQDDLIDLNDSVPTMPPRPPSATSWLAMMEEEGMNQLQIGGQIDGTEPTPGTSKEQVDPDESSTDQTDRAATQNDPTPSTSTQMDPPIRITPLPGGFGTKPHRIGDVLDSLRNTKGNPGESPAWDPSDLSGDENFRDAMGNYINIRTEVIITKDLVHKIESKVVSTPIHGYQLSRIIDMIVLRWRQWTWGKDRTWHEYLRNEKRNAKAYAAKKRPEGKLDLIEEIAFDCLLKTDRPTEGEIDEDLFHRQVQLQVEHRMISEEVLHRSRTATPESITAQLQTSVTIKTSAPPSGSTTPRPLVSTPGPLGSTQGPSGSTQEPSGSTGQGTSSQPSLGTEMLEEVRGIVNTFSKALRSKRPLEREDPNITIAPDPKRQDQNVSYVNPASLPLPGQSTPEEEDDPMDSASASPNDDDDGDDEGGASDPAGGDDGDDDGNDPDPPGGSGNDPTPPPSGSGPPPRRLWPTGRRPRPRREWRRRRGRR